MAEPAPAMWEEEPSGGGGGGGDVGVNALTQQSSHCPVPVMAVRWRVKALRVRADRWRLSGEMEGNSAEASEPQTAQPSTPLQSSNNSQKPHR